MDVGRIARTRGSFTERPVSSHSERFSVRIEQTMGTGDMEENKEIES